MKDRLLKILAIPSTKDNSYLMTHFLLNELNGIPTIIDDVGNLLVTKGQSETFPCVVCHIDTVHDWGKVEIEEKDGVLSSPIGIGGDDKCGIFICLELLKTFKNIKIAFFQQEESGCEGSNHADLNFFKDCRYIIGVDRKNNGDFITSYMGNKTASKGFKRACEPIMKDFGYKYSSGIQTDSFTLAERKVNLSCCNISCGFYEPHTKGEKIVIADVFKALFFVKALIHTLGKEKYEFSYERKTYIYPTGGYKQCDTCYSWKGDVVYRWDIKKFQCGVCFAADFKEHKTKYATEREWGRQDDTKWQCRKCLLWVNGGKWHKSNGWVCDDCYKTLEGGKVKETTALKRQDNLCATCPHYDFPTGTCTAGDSDNCIKETECDKYRNCFNCPQFFNCNLERAKTERVNSVEKPIEMNCEQCKAHTYFEPSWCCGCAEKEKHKIEAD